MYTLRIKELRKKHQVTQKTLAEYLNVAHQSISKWENHISSPDIVYLPKLADFFDVSVDALLGLVPLEHGYTKRDDVTANYWDKHFDKLQAMNHECLNDDYLRFLIRDVWQINSAVNVADFGCGYGYLGLKLLPLLPQGSTYTGYDISRFLLEKAQKAFDQNQLRGEFIQCDLNDYLIKDKYDLVVCKSFLQHHNSYQDMVAKMVEVGKSSAMVVCIEENRLIRNDGLFIEDVYDPAKKAMILKNNWQAELEHDGRHFDLAFRLPTTMKKLGLLDVSIRSNDRVQYMNQLDDDYDNQVALLKKTMIWDQTFTQERLERIYKYFQSRGLSKEDIDMYIRDEIKYAHHLTHHKPNIVRTLGLYMTYGRIPDEQNTRDQSTVLG